MWYIAHYEDDLDGYVEKEVWVPEGEDPLVVAYKECVLFDVVLRK